MDVLSNDEIGGAKVGGWVNSKLGGAAAMTFFFAPGRGPDALDAWAAGEVAKRSVAGRPIR